MEIKIPVSVGELLDRITILQIKSKHTDNEYVIKELQDLTKIADPSSRCSNLTDGLKTGTLGRNLLQWLLKYVY